MIDASAAHDLATFLLGAVTAVAVMLIARQESIAERRRLQRCEEEWSEHSS